MAYNPSLWYLSKNKLFYLKINKYFYKKILKILISIIFKSINIQFILKFIRIIDQYYDQNNSCDLRISLKHKYFLLNNSKPIID